MKKISNIFLYLLLLAGVASCSTEAPFTEEKGDGEGRFLASSLSVELKGDEKVVRAEDPATPDVKTFTVDFIEVEQPAEPVKSYTYGQMPEVVTLPVGNYTVKAYYGGKYEGGKKAGFDSPYYLGVSSQFTIEKNKICDNIGTVECKLANVKVTINFDASLVEAMSADSKVSVNVGESGSLDFTAKTKTSGYFAYDEGSTTMTAVFDGLIEGDPTTETKTYSDVKPGNHYKITFKLHKQDPNEPGGINPGEEGSEIKVDANIQLEDMTGENGVNAGIIGDKDIYMKDDRYPTEEPGPGPDEPTPDDPDGPKIVAVEGVKLDGWNLNPTACALKVTSETGITGFEVDIISDSLTPEELAQVGLGAHLNLITAEDADGNDLSGPLSGLGFPIKENVEGQKEVDFNITNFMPLLAALGDGDHTFVLKVTDESGTTEKQLKIRINQ